MVALVQCTWCHIFYRTMVEAPRDLRGSHYCPVCMIAGRDRLPVAAYKRPRKPAGPDLSQDPHLSRVMGGNTKAKGWSH